MCGVNNFSTFLVVDGRIFYMKTALIFGSSGLIGNHLLNLILNDHYYQKIKLFVRSKK